MERSTRAWSSGTREAALNLKQQGELCGGQREGASAVDALRIAVSEPRSGNPPTLRDEKSMRATLPAILLTAVLLSPVGAQDTPPDLKGVWSGLARSVVMGSGYHHPGTETDKEPPRVREVRFTYNVRGQDDRLVWGTFRARPTRNRSPGQSRATTEPCSARTRTASFG